MSYQPFIYQTLNNRKLTAVKASPMHDINSSGDSHFSQSREQFMRAYSLPLANSIENQKKWFKNRDSSSVIQKKRYNAIGNGSLNATNQPIQLSGQGNDVNRVKDALTRVRGGGYVTSAKVRAKPYTTGSALTPAYVAGPLIRTQNRSVVEVLGDPTNGQYTTMREKQPINNFIPVLPDSGFFNIYRKTQVSNNQPVLYH